MGASILFRILLAAAVAFALCASILMLLLRTGWAWRLATDVPNARSLHVRPTPRVGGWGIVPAILVGVTVFAPQFIWIALGAGLLAALSQLDDRHGLSARVRFGAHLLAVAALLSAAPAAAPWWVLVILAFLLLWLINLYNFMDGVDGLAGGMTVLGFAAYAIAAMQQNPGLASAAAIVAGAALAFLLFNFHPARIFLGDAGSIPIGYLAGALGYWGWRAEVWPIWFPALIFAPFIADASVTLLRRLLRREKFWEAHREHYYQRMVRMGVSHGRTACAWYLLISAGIMVSIGNLYLPVLLQWVTVALWLSFLVLLGWQIDRRWLVFNITKV